MAKMNTTTTTTPKAGTINDWYGPYLKQWQPTTMGAKPSPADLTAAHTLGARPGSKVALALAMYLRPAGATNLQVIMACGNPQNNKRRALIAAGLLKGEPMANNQANHVVYRVSLSTGKGKGKGASNAPVKGQGKVQAKGTTKGTSKGKGKGKAPAKVNTQANETPTVQPAPAA
jgi:hypothetical protein